MKDNDDEIKGNNNGVIRSDGGILRTGNAPSVHLIALPYIL